MPLTKDRHPNSPIAGYELKRATLVSALVEGERSGPSSAFDFAEFLALKRMDELARNQTPAGSPRDRANRTRP